MRGNGRANISLAKLRAPALCPYRTVGLKPLGREEVAAGEALGGSLLLVLACAAGSSRCNTLQAKWAKIL